MPHDRSQSMIRSSPLQGPFVNGCAANPTVSICIQGLPIVFVGKLNSCSPRPYRLAGMVCTIAPETGFHTRCTEKFSRSRNAAIVDAKVISGLFSVECHTTRGLPPVSGPPSMRASRCFAPGRKISGIASALLLAGLGILIGFEIGLVRFGRLGMASYETWFRHVPLQKSRRGPDRN